MTGRPRRIVAIVVAVLSMGGAAPPSFSFPDTPENAAEPFVEKVKDGAIDWGSGVVSAWGRVVDLDSPRFGEVSGQSRWGAEAAARERLLEIVRTLRADAQIRIGDRPEMVERVKQIVQGAKVIDQRQGRGRFFEVLVSLPLDGVDGLSPAIRRMTMNEDSHTQGATADTDAGAHAKEPSPGSPTGIVIDARGTGVAPGLLPRFVDEAGKVVASPDTVNVADLDARGMTAYGHATGDVVAWQDRVGDRPLRIRAVASSGALKTDVVLGRADADRIRSDPEAVLRFRECRVVVLVESTTP